MISRLAKTYPGGVKALAQVDLTCPAGAITALLGPNGAGKSTLVNCIAGLVLADGGTIRCRGADLVSSPSWARQHIAFVFEEAENVYDYLSVWENLVYFSSLNQIRPRRRAVAEQLAALDLEDKIDVEAYKLSRGMKQKLALLISILKGTDYLVMDEPTMGLDVPSRAQIVSFLQGLRDRDGKTILLTSHDMGVVQRVGDTFCFMDDGRVLWSGKLGELASLLGTVSLDQQAALPLEEAFLRVTRGTGR
ncbi:MAG TPA: ABC transporter ATP-binding protein [Bacillota bacterium]|nr:ABC transporter ATP-binding protein [Bacillota bacterium]